MKSNLFQPLFPMSLKDGDTNTVYPGISIFDFYASQAPRVPSDFEYVKPPNLPIHPGFFSSHFGKGSSYKYSEYVLKYYFEDEWVGEYEENVPPEIRNEIMADITAWNLRMDTYIKNIAAWKIKDKLERESQWRFAYATHMVEAREQWLDDYKYSMPQEEVEKIIKEFGNSANEIYSFPKEDTEVFLIEKLHVDPSENEVSTAAFYVPHGSATTEDEAIAYCNEGGIVPKDSCWALTQDTPKYRYKVLTPISKILKRPEPKAPTIDFADKAIKCDTWNQMKKLAAEAEKLGIKPLSFNKAEFTSKQLIYFITFSNKKEYTNTDAKECLAYGLTIVPFAEFIKDEPKG